MGGVIAIVLCLFFVGTGTFFNIIILNSAESAEPWIATLVYMIIVSVVICYLLVSERLKFSIFLIIVGISVVVQLNILEKIEMPFYWKDDEDFMRFYAAFLWQSVNWIVGLALASLVERRIKNKINANLDFIKEYLENQKKVLENINSIIKMNKNNDVLSEHLVSLFMKLGEQKLYLDYVEKNSKKEDMLLQSVRKLSDKSKIKVETEGRLLSEIEKEVEERLKEVIEKIEWWSNTKFKTKDYSMVLSEVKKLRHGR